MVERIVFPPRLMRVVLRLRKFTRSQVLFSELVMLALNPGAVLSFMRPAPVIGKSCPFFTR